MSKQIFILGLDSPPIAGRILAARDGRDTRITCLRTTKEKPVEVGGRGGLEDGEGEGIGTLGSAEQTLSEVSEFAIPDEDKANSPVTAVTGEEEV